jgi:isopenicillin N synthase-like dioxygenase/tRNA(Arg) A34 adenosine deaminase TadA
MNTHATRPFDEECLRIAIAESQKAYKNGNMPFGAVIANEHGKILVQTHNQSSASKNRGGAGDVTRHAEMELIRMMSDTIPMDIRPSCTIYASTEPCVMCAGAIYWSRVGRLVYGATSLELTTDLSGPGGFDIPVEQLYQMGREGTRDIQVVGPLLAEEAMKVHAESNCWPGCPSQTTKNSSSASTDDIDVERSLLASGLGAAASKQGTVPVIDMSVGSDEELAQQLFEAATTVGFFTVVGHGMDLELIDQTFQASADFFSQPLPEKESQSPFARNLNSGYEYMTQVRPSTGTNDQKESLQITARQGSMEDRWPSTPPQFQETTQDLLTASLALAQRILTLLQSKACPHLDETPGLIANSHALWGEDGQCTLRLLHYPPIDLERLQELTKPDDQGRIHWRAGPHTDWDNVTLLFQKPGHAGLECCSNPRTAEKGGETRYWTPVDPTPGGIAVNIGDMLARWSNGKLYSNLHRVRMPAVEECKGTPPVSASRYSMAFFAQSDKSTMIHSPTQTSSSNSDVPPITAGDYILSRIKSNFAT